MSGASPISVWGSQNGVPNHMSITFFGHSLERVLIVIMMGTLQIQREEGAGVKGMFSSHGYQYWN
jgi:hypothetical protein